MFLYSLSLPLSHLESTARSSHLSGSLKSVFSLGQEERWNRVEVGCMDWGPLQPAIRQGHPKKVGVPLEGVEGVRALVQGVPAELDEHWAGKVRGGVASVHVHRSHLGCEQRGPRRRKHGAKCALPARGWPPHSLWHCPGDSNMAAVTIGVGFPGDSRELHFFLKNLSFRKCT